MTARVPRGTFTRTCEKCGWTGTCETEGMADKSLNRHSCEKYRREREASERYRRRLAAVDRTPKPCLHKEAEHEHGTAACYKLDGCRCLPCVTARSEEERARARSHAYGRYDRYVDAEPVRQHVRRLRDTGMGKRQIQAAANISSGTMTKLLGTKSRKPTKRMLREVANRILAVEPCLADGAVVSSLGATRRLQALVALGWSQTRLAAEIGRTPSNFTPLIHGTADTSVATDRAVRDLYDRLSMTLPPEETRAERRAVSLARNRARQLGWLPPLAWDDDRIDDPTYQPSSTRSEPRGLDHAVVERFLESRERPGRRFSRDEAAEIVARLRARGLSGGAIERLGFKPERYTTTATRGEVS